MLIEIENRGGRGKLFASPGWLRYVLGLLLWCSEQLPVDLRLSNEMREVKNRATFLIFLPFADNLRSHLYTTPSHEKSAALLLSLLRMCLDVAHFSYPIESLLSKTPLVLGRRDLFEPTSMARMMSLPSLGSPAGHRGPREIVIPRIQTFFLTFFSDISDVWSPAMPEPSVF